MPFMEPQNFVVRSQETAVEPFINGMQACNTHERNEICMEREDIVKMNINCDYGKGPV
jgi:hypothetical protein